MKHSIKANVHHWKKSINIRHYPTCPKLFPPVPLPMLIARSLLLSNPRQLHLSLPNLLDLPRSPTTPEPKQNRNWHSKSIKEIDLETRILFLDIERLFSNSGNSSSPNSTPKSPRRAVSGSRSLDLYWNRSFRRAWKLTFQQSFVADKIPNQSLLTFTIQPAETVLN